MKYLYIILLFLTLNCSGNKVTSYHGNKYLEEKFDKIVINETNKNELISKIGPPSTVSDFNENKWFYFERIKTNQSLFKLGKQKIKKNNILIVELDKKGILIDKLLLDLNDMNDIKYLKTITDKEFKKNDNLLSGVVSTLREKINAPLKNR